MTELMSIVEQTAAGIPVSGHIVAVVKAVEEDAVVVAVAAVTANIAATATAAVPRDFGHVKAWLGLCGQNDGDHSQKKLFQNIRKTLDDIIEGLE